MPNLRKQQIPRYQARVNGTLKFAHTRKAVVIKWCDDNLEKGVEFEVSHPNGPTTRHISVGNNLLHYFDEELEYA